MSAEVTFSDAMKAWEGADEFTEIFDHAPGAPANRPVMSRPPRQIASKKFVREVADMLERSNSTEDVADWIADKMERFGAFFAEPMFDMEGNGPTCSWCKTLWPLCGHHHMSQRVHELPEAGERDA